MASWAESKWKNYKWRRRPFQQHLRARMVRRLAAQSAAAAGGSARRLGDAGSRGPFRQYLLGQVDRRYWHQYHPGRLAQHRQRLHRAVLARSRRAHGGGWLRGRHRHVLWFLPFVGNSLVHGGLFGSGQMLFIAACLVGGCVAGLAGYVIGIPSLRLRGDYLAIVTLGFGEIIRVLFTLSKDVIVDPEQVPKHPGRNLSPTSAALPDLRVCPTISIPMHAMAATVFF